MKNYYYTTSNNFTNKQLIMPGKKKYVQHTNNDKRYKRCNRVAMTECPFCCQNSLVEKKSGPMVWAECNNCGVSGFDERIRDNHLVDRYELLSTIVDANEEEEEEEEEEDEEESDYD